MIWLIAFHFGHEQNNQCGHFVDSIAIACEYLKTRSSLLLEIIPTNQLVMLLANFVFGFYIGQYR